MRISDWSSDVCSSDLPTRTADPREYRDDRGHVAAHPPDAAHHRRAEGRGRGTGRGAVRPALLSRPADPGTTRKMARQGTKLGRPSGREMMRPHRVIVGMPREIKTQ